MDACTPINTLVCAHARSLFWMPLTSHGVRVPPPFRLSALLHCLPHTHTLCTIISCCDVFSLTPPPCTKQLIQQEFCPTCTQARAHTPYSVRQLSKSAAAPPVQSAHRPSNPELRFRASPSIPVILTGWRLGLDAGLRVWTFGSEPVPDPERSLGW